MQPELSNVELTTIDLSDRIHPLDPRRIGPEGLVNKLVRLFEAAVNDPEIAKSYRAMTEALLEAGNHDLLVSAA